MISYLALGASDVLGAPLRRRGNDLLDIASCFCACGVAGVHSMETFASIRRSERMLTESTVAYAAWQGQAQLNSWVFSSIPIIFGQRFHLYNIH
jgi:hypothetical protein